MLCVGPVLSQAAALSERQLALCGMTLSSEKRQASDPAAAFVEVLAIKLGLGPCTHRLGRHPSAGHRPATTPAQRRNAAHDAARQTAQGGGSSGSQ